MTPVVTSSVQQESELTSHPQFVEFVMNFSINFPEKKKRNTVFTHVIVVILSAFIENMLNSPIIIVSNALFLGEGLNCLALACKN